MANVVNPNGMLGKDSFLQLMVDQMKNQDPLQPQDSSQFLNQLAQYTTMEQMMNIAQAETQMLQVNQMSFEHSLLGQTVTVQDDAGKPVTGQVSGISVNNGNPELMIGGTAYPLSSITEMSNGSQSSTGTSTNSSSGASGATV